MQLFLFQKIIKRDQVFIGKISLVVHFLNKIYETTIKMKKDIILILDGGCMRGVFNAGVASQFLKSFCNCNDINVWKLIVL